MVREVARSAGRRADLQLVPYELAQVTRRPFARLDFVARRVRGADDWLCPA
jgi:hypothetical protein